MNYHAVTQSGATPTVLVVEDECMVRIPIVEYLRDCGFRVLEAADAPGAIEVLEADGSIDLVFSDVRMPGPMDGRGLARWVREHHPTTPVLLTTGYSGHGNYDRGDVTRVIEKPYSQGEVMRQIAAILQRRRPAGRDR
ncbi:MAG TPA: response regulator [Acetobacteraceae bacterium]|nr:response regulator [Acetobacteraceae bacterium]